MSVPLPDVDMFVQWKLTNCCNFHCEYCINHDSTTWAKPLPIDKLLKVIDAQKKRIFFNFTGGEVFIIPNFVEFIEELTKKHYVSCDTNLSSTNACDKFMERIKPDHVLTIYYSTHVLEREKRNLSLEKLCKMVNKFQQRGFRMLGNYVAYPTLLPRMESDMEFFASRNLAIAITYFYGSFNNKQYPAAYTGQENELIKRLNPNISDLRIPSKGILCNAGSTCVLVHNEKIYPCYGLSHGYVLSDLYDTDWHLYKKVIRCPSEYCRCGILYTFVRDLLLEKSIKDLGIEEKK